MKVRLGTLCCELRATSHTTIESPWPLHCKHSHWWKRRSRSEFSSHYAWGTNIVCECKMDVKSTWITTWHWNGSCLMATWTIFKNPPLGGRPSTKPGNHGTLNAQNHWFIWYYDVWGPAWIETHLNSICLRARSHVTTHYTWGSMTTLHDFGGVLGWPLHTFFWTLNFMVTTLGSCVKWSRVEGKARLDSQPKSHEYFYS